MIQRNLSTLPRPHRKFLAILLGLFAVWWIFWSIEPRSQRAWRLENILVILTIATLVITARWFVFSRVSYTLAVVFAGLHTVGAHYTYSNVPLDAWSDAIAGISIQEMLGWERNHFDRIIHFLYGLLITWPYREVFYHAAKPRHTFWGYLLPFSFILSTSLGYELLEWAAALVFGGDLGMMFLGTQGDIWDAHWDMFAATVGALLCIGIMVALRIITGRDFAREWATANP